MADEKGKGKSPEEEVAQYQDILAKDPTSRVFARLAEAHRKAGQLEYAISVSREGLKNHPGYTAGQVVLARALFEVGKSEEARAEITKVVAAAPDNLTAQKILAQIAVRLNDGPTAEKAYRMVQLLDPSDGEAQNYLSGAAGESPAMAPPPAYDMPPIESAPPPAESLVTEPPIVEATAPADQAKEEGLPPGLTFEEDPAAAPVTEEQVFDLGEMESAPVEEGPEPEAPADDSLFEVFTKEPRREAPPPAAREERAEPFAEIEFPGDDVSDVEPAMEEPAAVVEELPEEISLGEVEEVAELVIDDVEPVIEEPAAVVEEMPEEISLGEAEEVAELVIDDGEPIVEEPAAVVEELPEEIPLGEAEEVTELVIDEPAMDEPPAEMEELLLDAEEPIAEPEVVTELVVDEMAMEAPPAMEEEPAMEEPPVTVAEEAPPAEPPAEPDDGYEAFDVGEAEDRRAGGDRSPEGVFNTETLANLYVTQGFYGKAADVYRQMLTDRPGDTNLRQKLEEVLALEKMQAPSVHEDPVPVAAEAPRVAGIGTESPVIEELQRLLTKLKEKPR